MINCAYILFLFLSFSSLAAGDFICLRNIIILSGGGRDFVIDKNDNLGVISFGVAVNLITIFNKNGVVIIFENSIDFLIIVISFAGYLYLLVGLDFLGLYRWIGGNSLLVSILIIDIFRYNVISVVVFLYSLIKVL